MCGGKCLTRSEGQAHVKLESKSISEFSSDVSDVHSSQYYEGKFTTKRCEIY